MRTFTFKGLFLTAVFMLLGCLTIQAADNDLITKQITIKLDEAGTLPDKIGNSRMYDVTNLKIIGEINGTDLRMIREMAGSNYNAQDTKGKLSVLDLSEAKIVEGGGSYYRDYYTSNDQIGNFAFFYCSRLKSLTLPSSITSIGYRAFYECSGLTSLTISSNITKIGGEAFEHCYRLTSLNLPDGITTIGSNAFYGCSGLTSINLPASITEIDWYAFKGCSRLKEVKFCINDDLEKYLTKGHPYINVDCDIKYYLNDKEIISIEIPSSVTTLGYNVFQKCSGLTSLTLPSSITEIGDGAFQGCSGLKEVKFCINEDLETYLTKGHPYIKVDCDINYYLNDKEVTSIVIPSNVTSLGDYAFQKCSTLQSVYVSWSTPISAGNAFYEVNRKNCTLYVPQGTEQDYFLADVWGDFENIVEFDATGIDKTTTSTDVEEVSRYSVNGQRLVGPTKGLNIVKYSDGSVKKVAVE